LIDETMGRRAFRSDNRHRHPAFERLPAGFSAPVSSRFSLCARNGKMASRTRFTTALLRAGLTEI
jgi:hypothetical protein